MRAVNLLPRDTRSTRSVTSQNLPAVVGGGVGVLVVAALAGGYLSASSKVAAAQRALDTAKTQLAATPVPPAPTQTTPTQTTPAAVASQQAPRLQAVSAALSHRFAWDRLLREFSLVLPPDVWIQSLNLTAPAAAGATNGFSITGTTYSYDSVARMLTRVNLIPDLSAVTLTSTTGSGRLVSFTITAGIKGAPAAPAPAAPVVPPTTDTTSTTGTPSS